MSDKPRWEKWKGETRPEYEKRLQAWTEENQRAVCKRCKFYCPGFQAGRGDCFRYPDTKQVSELHWCGEFKGK